MLKENKKEVTSAGVFQLETSVLDTIAKEEKINMAKAEENAEEHEISSLNRQLGDSFCDIIVSFCNNL